MTALGGAHLGSAFAAGLALALASQAPGIGQEPASVASSTPLQVETQTHGGWLLGCVDGGLETARCEMIQRVVDPTGDVQILSASLVAAYDEPTSEIVFTTPLGVWLEPGLVLAVAGDDSGAGVSRALTFERCSPSGCLARAPLDAELRDALGAGGAGELRFADRLKRPLAAPVGLDGFADALAAMAAATSPPVEEPRKGPAWLRWFGQ